MLIASFTIFHEKKETFTVKVCIYARDVEKTPLGINGREYLQ